VPSSRGSSWGRTRGSSRGSETASGPRVSTTSLRCPCKTSPMSSRARFSWHGSWAFPDSQGRLGHCSRLPATSWPSAGSRQSSGRGWQGGCGGRPVGGHSGSALGLGLGGGSGRLRRRLARGFGAFGRRFGGLGLPGGLREGGLGGGSRGVRRRLRLAGGLGGSHSLGRGWRFRFGDFGLGGFRLGGARAGPLGEGV